MSTDDPQARIKKAGAEFTTAVSAAVRQSMRQAIARQIAEEHGPGPWILHPDGRVEPYSAPVSHPRRKTQTKKENPT